MLAPISTEILGVSAQVGLTATSAIGAGCPGIASAGWQVSSRQWNTGQARIQRLFVGVSMRRVLFQYGSGTQRSQSGNRCGEDVEMHDAKGMNGNL